MPIIAAYTLLQLNRIAAFDQHVLTIVGFKKNSIALAKILFDVGAGMADISKYTNCHMLTPYDKTVWVDCIMRFGKGHNGQVANLNSVICLKRMDQVFFNRNEGRLKRVLGYINRELVFSAQGWNAVNMIAMFV